ncbi:MAG: UDP-N-acetylmuramoyl-L-alanine--D-glutamate ligase [Pseudomonadota bacterium]
MIPVRTFAGRRVLVFGLGGSGLISAQALLAGGADVLAGDDNPTSIDAASAAGVPVGNLRDVEFASYDALLLAPGVPLTHPAPHWSAAKAHAAGLPIIGDVALFAAERRARAPDAPFIAITGTNGKSTTTALIAHVLQSAGRTVAMGGNIGVPVLRLPDPGPHVHYVVECSSYQIDLAPDLDPTVGIFLNLTADHLDRHGTIETYAAVKERLVAGTTGTAIVGVDDPYGAAIAERNFAAGRATVTLSVTGQSADIVADGSVLRADDGAAFSLDGIETLRGAHNAQNAAAAIAAAQAVGLGSEDIQSGLRSFPGLAHRMEVVGRIPGAMVVNDSKGTNADATARALDSFERIYWVLGGVPKSGGIDSLKEFFPKIVKAYLIGEAAPAFARTLHNVPHMIAGTLERAVEAAAHDAAEDGVPGGVVLLSPAAASFDQYRSFEVRGDAFRTLVQALPGFEPMT